VVTKKEAKMEWIDVPAADAEQTGKGEGITRVWRRKSSTTPLPAMLPTSIWTRREETGWCLCEWEWQWYALPSIHRKSFERECGGVEVCQAACVRVLRPGAEKRKGRGRGNAGSCDQLLQREFNAS
jgi:hypothetical protein